MFGKSTDDVLTPEDTFDAETEPSAGAFLEPTDVLEGDDHLAFHATTREVFEQRGVYDITFGYNLAELNRDTRHPDAGYRYGETSDDVLRAVFTPTTPFCPQSRDLTVGSFRAWNGLSEEHPYDVVQVRVDPMHHESDRINRELDQLAVTVAEDAAAIAVDAADQ